MLSLHRRHLQVHAQRPARRCCCLCKLCKCVHSHFSSMRVLSDSRVWALHSVLSLSNHKSKCSWNTYSLSRASAFSYPLASSLPSFATGNITWQEKWTYCKLALFLFNRFTHKTKFPLELFWLQLLGARQIVAIFALFPCFAFLNFKSRLQKIWTLASGLTLNKTVKTGAAAETTWGVALLES